MISAVLNDTWLDQTTPAGSDDAVGTMPGTHLVVPGSPGSAVPGNVVLRVAATDDRPPCGCGCSAPTGPTAASGGQRCRCRSPRHTVKDIALTGLPAGYDGLELTSTAPVVAGVQLRTAAPRAGRKRDLAWTAAEPALSGLAGVALGDRRGARGPTRWRSPPRPPTPSSTSSTSRPTARESTQQVTVSAGTTTAVAVPLTVAATATAATPPSTTPPTTRAGECLAAALAAARSSRRSRTAYTDASGALLSVTPAGRRAAALHAGRRAPARRLSGPAQSGEPYRGSTSLRLHPDQVGDLLDHDVVHQPGGVAQVAGPGLHRPAVDHDPRRVAARAGEQPAQRHLAVLPRGRVAGRHVLHRELDLGQLLAPALVEPLGRVQHQPVELLGPAAGQRQAAGDERSAQARGRAGPSPPADPSGRQPSASLVRPRRQFATRGRQCAAPVGARRYASEGEFPATLLAHGLRHSAVATLTYVYSDSTAVLGPLAMYAEPHTYDLCSAHAERLTAPRGWEVLRLAPDLTSPARRQDDLLALADAVREAGRPRRHESSPRAEQPPSRSAAAATCGCCRTPRTEPPVRPGQRPVVPRFVAESPSAQVTRAALPIGHSERLACRAQ